MGLKLVGVQMTADGAASFSRALNESDQAVTRFGTSATAASGKVNAFGEIAKGALRQVGSIATNALADAGRALIGLVGESVKKAGDFEAGMKEFAAVTGASLKDSGKSLKDFSDLFIQLGRDLPVSTKDVEQAAIELAKGGIDPATIAAGALKTSLSLAAAGGLGLADSANILSKQLGVWVDTAASAGDKSTFLTQTADLLSQAANVTTSNVSDMALGLANVGGVAKVAGLSFHETVQALAEISPSFSGASDAGTSFKTFLQRLQPTTKPAVAAMKDLGLFTDKTGSAFYDAQGNFVGMEKATALLQAATSGLTQSQKSLAFQTIFGTDAIRTAAILSEKGAAGYADMGKQMDAAGSVASQAAARQQGLNTAWENAQGSVEALQLTVGAALIPMLTDLLNNTIAPGINTVTTWASAILSSVDPMAALGASIETAVPGFLAFASGVQSAATWLSDNLVPVAITAGSIIVASLVPAMTSAVLAFGAAVVAGAPLVLGLAAIGVAAYGLYTAWTTDFLGIQTSVTTLWQTVGPIFTGFSPVLQSIVTLAGNVATAFGDGGVGGAFRALAAGLPAVTGAFSTWASSAGTILLGLADAFVAWIAPFIPKAMTALQDFGNAVVNWITQEAPVLGAQLLAWGAAFVAWVAPQIGPLITKAEALGTALLTWIGAQAAPILAQLGTWATSFLAWIPGATTDFLAKWPGFLNQFLDWIGTAAGPLLLKLGDWSLKFVEWIAPMIPGFIVALGGIAVALVTFIAETAVVLVDKLQDWGRALGGWIATTAIPELGKAWVLFTDSLNTLLDKGNKWLADKAAELGHAIISGISAGLDNAAGALYTKLNGMASTILSTFQNALHIHSPSQVFADEVGQPIVEGMQLGILQSMPGLLAVMRASTDSLIQEIVSFVDDGATDSKLNATGAAAINALIGGMQGQIDSVNIGRHLVLGMGQDALRAMPDVVAAMRKSTNSLIQEIIGFLDDGQGGNGPYSQAGIDAINAFIAGMQGATSGIPAAFSNITSAMHLLFTPPDTTSLTSALDTVKGTVMDLGTLLRGNSMAGDTKQTFGSIVDLTNTAWQQVRDGISANVIEARTTVDTATSAILQVTTDSFTRTKAASDLAWSQIHLGIKDQITQTQANVKLSTDEMLKGTTDTFTLMQTDSTRIWGQIHLDIQDQITRTQTGLATTTSDMQKATTATWGRIGSDAASGWTKVRSNIETPVAAAKDTVATNSTAMQTSMVIPASQQSQIADSYKTVTDTMVEQIHHVRDAINDLYNRSRALLDLPKPSAPKSGDSSGGSLGTGITGTSAPPGGSRASGGPVWAGMPTLVGEKGRELFVPQTNGVVLPNSLTQRIAPPASSQQISHSAIYNQQVENTFNLTAQYKYQDQRTLAQDVRMMQLLYPST